MGNRMRPERGYARNRASVRLPQASGLRPGLPNAPPYVPGEKGSLRLSGVSCLLTQAPLHGSTNLTRGRFLSHQASLAPPHEWEDCRLVTSFSLVMLFQPLAHSQRQSSEETAALFSQMQLGVSDSSLVPDEALRSTTALTGAFLLLDVGSGSPVPAHPQFWFHGSIFLSWRVPLGGTMGCDLRHVFL